MPHFIFYNTAFSNVTLKILLQIKKILQFNTNLDFQDNFSKDTDKEKLYEYLSGNVLRLGILGKKLTD